MVEYGYGQCYGVETKEPGGGGRPLRRHAFGDGHGAAAEYHAAAAIGTPRGYGGRRDLRLGRNALIDAFAASGRGRAGRTGGGATRGGVRALSRGSRSASGGARVRLCGMLHTQ